MKYLAFDFESIKEIVNTRLLQSHEFEFADQFCAFIKDSENTSLGVFSAINFENGKVIHLQGKIEKNSCLVFDVESCNILRYSNKELLLVIQRVLRFVTKAKNAMSFSKAEHWLPGYAQEIGFCFPFFSYTNLDSVKAFVDVAPDSKRQSKREQTHYLCFEISDKMIKPENRNLVVFRKFLDEIRFAQVADEEDRSVINYKIDSHEFDKINGPISFDALDFNSWKQYITKKQKEFIFGDLNGPVRLLGPAGSGKTLSLILKGVNLASISEKHLRIGYITYSQSLKKSVLDAIKKIVPNFRNGDIYNPPFLEVATLQEICLKKMSQVINETELLDTDSSEAKIVQTFQIVDSISQFIKDDYKTFANHISQNLAKVFADFQNGIQLEIADIFLTEISSIIKGRANCELDAYEKLERPKYGLPVDINNKSDYSAVFRIFSIYQNGLERLGQYDTDDVTITALASFNSPIWQRRKVREGYDVLVIDEMHLFNFNEMTVFHKILADQKSPYIVFAYDQVQNPNDMGMGVKYLEENQLLSGAEDNELNSVFRCSKPIFELAEHIISYGSLVFQGFPSHDAENSCITYDLSDNTISMPNMHYVNTDEEYGDKAYSIACHLVEDQKLLKSDILICCVDEIIYEMVSESFKRNNKPYVRLDRKSDFQSIAKAKHDNLFVLSHIDQVGGTEFMGVIVLGANKGSFPNEKASSIETRHYHEYRAYSKLYVAITRAKQYVNFICLKSEGPSDILKKAIENEHIKEKGV